MKKLFLFAVFLSLMALLFSTGCSVVVRPTVSPSEFIEQEQKVPATVALYITDEFLDYTYEHFDWVCDARNYVIKTGPMASDWFRYALENKFEKVVVRPGEPEFPISTSKVDFVLKPEFTSFEVGGPWVVKFENYWVSIGMRVKIYDDQGKVLETLEMEQKGTKGGSIGLEPGSHIYPETCRIAIRAIVNQTIDKLTDLVRE